MKMSEPTQVQYTPTPSHDDDSLQCLQCLRLAEVNGFKSWNLAGSIFQSIGLVVNQDYTPCTTVLGAVCSKDADCEQGSESLSCN